MARPLVCGKSRPDLARKWTQKQVGLKKYEGKLEDAYKLCEALGYDGIRDVPIRFFHDLGSGVIGRAVDGIIYISIAAFSRGNRWVAMTILEEYIHIKYKYKDETYEFQNYLFDIIGELGEELIALKEKE